MSLVWADRSRSRDMKPLARAPSPWFGVSEGFLGTNFLKIRLVETWVRYGSVWEYMFFVAETEKYPENPILVPHVNHG